MPDIDKEIADLEERLLRLKAERLKSTGRETWNIGDPVTVLTEEEMDLALLPQLARVILDSISSQVFIKRADYTPGRGRKYIYMNRAARRILKWDRDSVPDRFDGDAVAGGVGGDEYQRMREQEETTLAQGRSRETSLEWTAQSKGGGWRKSKTVEISILDRARSAIGFCAVGEDTEFRLGPTIHWWLRSVFEHEYNNASNQVIGRAREVEARLVGLLAEKDISLGEGGTTDVRLSIDDLDIMRRRLSLGARVSRILIESYGYIHEREADTVGQIKKKLDELYEGAPFAFECRSSPSALFVNVRQSRVIIGVLVELISNAVKHSTLVNGVETVKVFVDRSDNGTTWIVSNRSARLTGELSIGRLTKDTEIEDAPRLGSLVIRDLLSRAFPSEVIEKMVQFPGAIDEDGWVNVRLNCTIVPELEPFPAND